MKTKGKILLSIVIGLLLIQSVDRATAPIVWEEDFETPPFDEWTLQGHVEADVNPSTRLAYPTTAVPEIIDGKLQMPVVTKEPGNLSVSSAIRNSTIAYGTWSFDWEINSSTGTEHEAWVNVWFITDMPINLTGVNLEEPFFDGYALMLQSASEGYSGVEPSCIYLWKPTLSGGYTTLASYDIPGTKITGSHNIKITRNPLDGKFNVWFDSSHIITATHNSITTSERFFFRSHLGDSAFDNLTVSDSVDKTVTETSEPSETTTTSESSETTDTTTTETSEYPHMFVLIVSISVIIILRRKRTS
jgi:hypothetical protein